MQQEMPIPGFKRLERRVSRARLAQLYVQVFDSLVRYVMRKHRRSFDDAQDLVQEAFVRGLKKIVSIRNVRTWLIHTLDHLALNEARKDARRAELFARWHDPESR